jgi:hypothetical protein
VSAARVFMWETRAADGRRDELVAYLTSWASGDTQLYADQERVVVIGAAVPEPPAELMARAPHAWDFERLR